MRARLGPTLDNWADTPGGGGGGSDGTVRRGVRKRSTECRRRPQPVISALAWVCRRDRVRLVPVRRGGSDGASGRGRRRPPRASPIADYAARPGNAHLSPGRGNYAAAGPGTAASGQDRWRRRASARRGPGRVRGPHLSLSPGALSGPDPSAPHRTAPHLPEHVFYPDHKRCSPAARNWQ